MDLFPPPPPPGVDYDPSPPGYEAGPSATAATATATAQASGSEQASQIFFDCVPRSDQTSFQVGYLGLEGFQAWVKGDVLVKFDKEAQPEAAQSTAFDRCTVSFTAVEAAGEQSVTLFSSTQTLWEAPSNLSSSSGSSSTSSSPASLPPSTMPFSFPLTSDLPHCVHLAQSGLLYELVARLHSADARSYDVERRTPVHLTRYTRPGPIASLDVAATSAARGSVRFSAEPHVWYLETPTPLSIQLRRTLFRRAEPMEVRVRIPPPSSNLVSEKGLRLRSVEAELVRVIHVRNDEAATPAAVLAADGKEREVQEVEAPLYSPGITEDASSSSSSSAKLPPDDASPGGAASTSPSNSVEAILAHSGKLCRFHSRSAILLRLALHPPFDVSNMPFPHPDHDAAVGGRGPMQGRGGGGGCESVSQETLLHDVRFMVRIKVGMRGGAGEKRDVSLEREVRVLPGAAGAGLPRELFNATPGNATSLKEKEAATSADEADALDAVAGSSSNATAELVFEDFGSDEEYDGYEDIGRSLGDGEADSSEDEDDDEVTARLLSIPSLGASGSSSSAGSTSAAQGGPSTGDVKSAAAASSTSPDDVHASQLAQLRALLENDSSSSSSNVVHSSAPSRAEDPPPSILESRNDVQLEVEVAGVGFAMPRHNTARRGSGGTLRARSHAHVHAHEEVEFEYAEQPPPLDEDIRHYENRDAWRSTSAAAATTTAQSAALYDDAEEPPPPISPVPGSAEMEPPHRAAAAYEDVGRGREGEERPAYPSDALPSVAQGQNQPPPYIPAPSRAPLHQPPRSSARGGVEGEERDMPPSHAEATNHPPAYPEAPAPRVRMGVGVGRGRGADAQGAQETPRRSTSLRVSTTALSGAGPPSYEA